MKLEAFFEKFDLFADAPRAVGKMRELVRHLAITGKLVPQKSDDEPSTLLLDKIIAHKSALAKEGKLRGSTSIVPMMEDDVEYRIPASWTWVRFGDVMVNRDGERIPVSKEERETRDKIYDYYGASGVIDKIDNYLFEKPLLLIGEDGANLITRSKPIAFIASGKYWVNNHAHVLDGISEDFLRYVELYINAINLERYVTGSAQPKMNQAKMNSIPVAIPPLAEQKRIVEKVNELMALCDRLEAQQQERETRHAALARASLARFAEAPTPANLNFLFHPSYSISPTDLRKYILTLAVRGKLVPQCTNDEPAETLFAKLENERRRFAETHKFRAPVGEPLDDSSVPFAIPTSWKWCRLSSMLNAVTDGDHLPPPKSEAGIAFLTIGNITTGTLDFEGSRFVPDSYYRGLANFRRPVRGDILYTVVGATYGRPALVETDRPFCVQRHIAILKPPRCIDVGFLMVVLRSPLAYEQASASTTGTAQPTIPLGSLRNFAAPLPPLAEQRRIVAQVEQLMALVDALERQFAASRATAANLLSALVAELTGTPESRVASPASAKQVAALPRPKPQKATVATAKPAAQESTVSSKTITDLRKAANLTQAAVAEAMGLNQAYISQMETGKRPITKEQHSNLLKIFGMNADEVP